MHPLQNMLPQHRAITGSVYISVHIEHVSGDNNGCVGSTSKSPTLCCNSIGLCLERSTASCRRVCWSSKSLLGLEEFTRSRRESWGPKSLKRRFPTCKLRRVDPPLVSDNAPLERFFPFFSHFADFHPSEPEERADSLTVLVYANLVLEHCDHAHRGNTFQTLVPCCWCACGVCTGEA
jgi:hypothetical protein